MCCGGAAGGPMPSSAGGAGAAGSGSSVGEVKEPLLNVSE